MKTFSTDCLKAIAHLSQNMQNRIIADVTRFMLTGQIPAKLPAMRRALMISLILMLDPKTDISALTASADTSADTDTRAGADNATLHSSSSDFAPVTVPGSTVPLYVPSVTAPHTPRNRAEKRRLMRAVM